MVDPSNGGTFSPVRILEVPSFGPIAEYYDDLMGQVPYEMWADYFELLLLTMEKSPKSMLDVCCGTGTVAELMCKRGYEVSGIDLSEPMIIEAQRKAAEMAFPIEYRACDAANFDFGRQFDAAYSFFDSFNYITDLGHLEKAFINIARHLPAGAPLIFDLNTPFAFEQKMFDQEDTRKKTTVKYKWRGDYDARTRIIRVEMDFWVGDKEFKEVHVQRAHSRDEIFEALWRAGFENVMAYDSYTLDPPRKRSDRVHIACVRSS